MYRTSFFSQSFNLPYFQTFGFVIYRSQCPSCPLLNRVKVGMMRVQHVRQPRQNVTARCWTVATRRARNANKPPKAPCRSNEKMQLILQEKKKRTSGFMVNGHIWQGDRANRIRATNGRKSIGTQQELGLLGTIFAKKSGISGTRQKHYGRLFDLQIPHSSYSGEDTKRVRVFRPFVHWERKIPNSERGFYFFIDYYVKQVQGVGSN